MKKIVKQTMILTGVLVLSGCVSGGNKNLSASSSYKGSAGKEVNRSLGRYKRHLGKLNRQVGVSKRRSPSVRYGLLPGVEETSRTVVNKNKRDIRVLDKAIEKRKEVLRKKDIF